MNVRSRLDKDASIRLRTTAELAKLALRESEIRKSAIMESALDCIITADHHGRIIDFNPAAEQTFGYSRITVIGKTLAETIIPPLSRAAHERGMARYLATGDSAVLGKRFEISAMRADGSEFPIELAITPFLVRDQPVFIAYLRDISPRKQSEQKIARLTNLYAALSESSEAIVRSVDRDSLFREVCRIAVDYGHFGMSWIGLIDPAARQLVLGASSGDDHEFFKTLPWPLDLDKPMGYGPAATACRENRPYICNDIANDPNTLPWRTAVARAGFRATASFPIRQHNEVIGVLGLYASEVGFFDAQLSDLMRKMAANISLALDNFAHDAKRRAVAKALRESEARYRQLVDLSPEAILICDDGRFALVNRACVRILGAASETELIGRPIIDFVHPGHRTVALERASDVLEKRDAGVFTEARWMRVDGTAFDAEIAGTLIKYRGRMVLQAVVRDISERKHTEQILRILAEGTALSFGAPFFPALVQQLAAALQVRCAVVAECLDDQFTRARVLAFWQDNDWISGYDYDIANTPCQKLLQGDGLCYYPENVQQHFPGNERLPALNISCYLGLPLYDTARNIIGHIFVMHDSPLPNEERAKSIFGIFAARAAAELVRKRAEEDIRHMAHHDALTGLPNRLLFHDRISQAIVQARRNQQQVAVLFLDLDRFKNINDTLGHEAGDRALREMARRLRASLRESDTIARVGGDEFMVLIDSFADPRYLSEVAQKILDSASRPLMLEGQECQVTASVGIATYPNDGDDVQQLLKNADIAMYRAKSLGKNNFQFYSAQMNVHTLEHLALESRLRRAIGNRELMLHYQPKVCLDSGRIRGVEALVRWQHPRGDALEADDFIPLAEETDLIVKLGEWVIDEACAQAVRWQRQGLPALCVAINLSARQFTHEGLLPIVREALRNTGLDPGYVEFEITESMVMDDPERAAALMHELKALGVKLSIDDFGTGYSSLAYLKRFPIDTLKIDRSFIQGVPDDSDDVAITQAVIAMAHSMKLTVIAEGVETEAQAGFLRQNRCDQLQGYYFSKPLPAETFAELLKTGFGSVKES